MRLFNRVVAVVVSLGLAFVAVILVIELITQRLGNAPLTFDWNNWYNWLATTTLSATSVRIVSGVLLFVGLVLLAFELKPRRPDRLKLVSEDDATDAAITRRGLARSVKQAVTDVDGVTAAKVRVHRRRVKVKAKARAADEPGARVSPEMLTDVARGAVDAMRLRRQPRLKVRIATREP